MIRNIPNKFKSKLLLDEINKNHQGKFDYFYLPMDLQTKCNVGFGFINFIHPFYILNFFLEFHKFDWQKHYKDCNSSKICQLVMANLQGRDSLSTHH